MEEWYKQPYFKNQENEPNVQSILDVNFREKTKHLLSSTMEENPYRHLKNNTEYEKLLKPYQIQWEEIKEYNKKNPLKIKSDFIDPGNSDIGWKIHLNTEPKFVETISKHLKQNGYVHKYLSGGEVEDGKIFTVYTGSQELTQKLAQEISNILQFYLSKPIDKTEIELSKGIIARFRGPKYGSDSFHQYGTSGFSWLNEDMEKYINFTLYNKQDKDYEEKKSEFVRKGETNAFLKLRELYKDYFYKI